MKLRTLPVRVAVKLVDTAVGVSASIMITGLFVTVVILDWHKIGCLRCSAIGKEKCECE